MTPLPIAAALALLIAASAPSGQSGCTAPAAVEGLGHARRGGSGLLRLSLEGAPIVGSPFRLVVEDGGPGTHGRLMIGPPADLLPPSGSGFFPGRPSFVTVFVFDGDGRSPRLLQQLPVGAALCGSSFVVQAAAAGRGGPSLSQALRVTFGLGNGGVGFERMATQEIAQNALDAEVVDMDGDGIPDLVINALRAGRVGDLVAVLLGKGDGTFRGEERFSGGEGHPGRIACGDVDGDGSPDVVSAGGEGQLLLGQGDGRLGPPVGLGLPSTAGVAVGDVDGDDRPDVLMTNQITAHELLVLIGNGDGTFLPPSSYPTGRSPISIALGDMDGDGHVDVVTGNRELDGFGTPGSISLLLGHGDGTFDPPVTLAAHGTSVTSAVHRVRVHDLDDDGVLDVVALVYRAHSLGRMAVFRGLGGGAFAPFRGYAVEVYPQDFRIADVDRDLRQDLIVSNHSEGVIEVLFGLGGGNFAPRVAFRMGRSVGTAIVVSDMDGDQMPDVVVVDGLAQSAGVMRNTVLR